MSDSVEAGLGSRMENGRWARRRWIDWRLSGWISGWVGGRDGWINGRMDEWRGRWIWGRREGKTGGLRGTHDWMGG